MADTIQLDGHAVGPEPLTFQPPIHESEMAAILAVTFDDINEADATFEQCIDAQAKAPISSALEIFYPSRPSLSHEPSASTSCTDSTAGSAPLDATAAPFSLPWQAVRNYTAEQNVELELERELDLDDWINPGAYDPPAAKAFRERTGCMPHEVKLDRGIIVDSPVDTKALEVLPVIPIVQSVPSLHTTGDPSRKLSKKRRTETSNTLSGTSDKKPKWNKPKRNKPKKNGFPCEQCGEVFDRCCDRTKHMQRAHAPKESHAHPCMPCEAHGRLKRFLYPKDLRRHFKQVHNIIITDMGSRSKSISSISPISADRSPQSPKTSVLWSLLKSVVSLKKLRITPAITNGGTAHHHHQQNHQEPLEEKIIMVSLDQKQYQDVDVTGVLTPEALVLRIFSTLDLEDIPAPSLVQAQLASRQQGASRLGERLGLQQMFDVVAARADAQASLRLFISVIDGASVFTDL